MKKIPMDEWSVTHHRMIFFGRYHCKARRPQCEECPFTRSMPRRKEANEGEIKDGASDRNTERISVLTIF